MTDLGRLIRAIRLKKNISEIKAAKRSDLGLNEYMRLEANPEQASGHILSRILIAIEISGEEYLDFNFLVHKLFQSKLDDKDSNNMEDQELI